MAGKILDNGALVTLGLVAAVAAVGAANKAGLYGSRATVEERVADLQFDMTTLFGAREVKRPSELKRMRERVLTENADLLRRIQTQKERGIDTRLLERDLRARIR
jgi:hypothetical protein